MTTTIEAPAVRCAHLRMGVTRSFVKYNDREYCLDCVTDSVFLSEMPRFQHIVQHVKEAREQKKAAPKSGQIGGNSW